MWWQQVSLLSDWSFTICLMPYYHKKMSASLQINISVLPSFTDPSQQYDQEGLSPELSPFASRQIVEVTLEKDPNHGIGLTIVGGETTSKLDLGIFIKTLTPQGPADTDGRIQPGDRLLAINGRSLEGVQHNEAVQLIRDSPSTIALLVSQIRLPSSVRRRSLHSTLDSAAEIGNVDHVVNRSSPHPVQNLKDSPPEMETCVKSKPVPKERRRSLESVLDVDNSVCPLAEMCEQDSIGRTDSSACQPDETEQEELELVGGICLTYGYALTGLLCRSRQNVI